MTDSIVHPPKRCGKCGVEFPATLEYFQKDKQTKSGLSSYCKPCKHAKGKRYYENNREHVLERTAKYAKEHPEQRKEINRRQRERDPQAHIDRARAWNKAHPEIRRERVKISSRKRRSEHPDETRAAVRRHYQNNKANYKAYSNKRRALKKAASGAHTASDIRALYKSQHGNCWWCGKSVGDRYHVDHRIPLDRGGSNAPDNLCIACPECNLSKGNKLPHEWSGRLL